jgi:hypothetical protein
MQPLQRHVYYIYIYILQYSANMRYLYQKDKRALPGNLQNRRYSFMPPPPPNVVSLATSPHFFLFLSLSMSSVEFCTGGCEDGTWALEAEESPLLEAVVRERLLKTLQAGEDLASSDFWTVEISGGAEIACSSESCV